ncbi:MAG: NYN domain-containing protein [Firmicutes bacterium]|nr:NYN domain-containing protein [Bacillota bacterium]
MKSKRLNIGILAHVDAGKTTLSEQIAFQCGITRKVGRVDHGDALLDFDEIERRRGITVFAQQADLVWKGRSITLLDTPGHTDLKGEASRCLGILDLAVLVVDGSRRISGYTRRLFSELKARRIPTILFINKTDLAGYDAGAVRKAWNALDPRVLFDPAACEPEQVALSSEKALAIYTEKEAFSPRDLAMLVGQSHLVPAYSGAALRGEGIAPLLDAIVAYGPVLDYPETFGARVYKISRDEKGTRLTHVKITGGCLQARSEINGEKITSIRRYTAMRSISLETVEAGTCCTLTGLNHTFAGQGLGYEDDEKPEPAPSVACKLRLPAGTDPFPVYKKILELAEELPEIAPCYQEEAQEITLALRGEVQKDLIRDLLARRYGLQADFSPAAVAYLETIAAPAEGAGHFEPLRHYAEVHLLLEPLPRGSGIEITTALSTDDLDSNRQSAVLTTLADHALKGVLTGAPLTDVRFTLIAGREHVKHMEGGDFREATLRAYRQGLMKAENILLEPYYRFTMTVPEERSGRIISDLERMHAEVDHRETNAGYALLGGIVPVSESMDYLPVFQAATSGDGDLDLTECGYRACHNAAEIMALSGYDPARDVREPAGSVFCRGGAAVYLSWQEADQAMHLPFRLKPDQPESRKPVNAGSNRDYSLKKLEAIFERTYGKRNRDAGKAVRIIRHKDDTVYKGNEKGINRSVGAKVLVVDGYNVIFRWEDLKTLAASDIGAARDRLTELLADYGAYTGEHVILVFDAYRNKGRIATQEEVLGVEVVFTGENETADSYIEKLAFARARKEQMTVATSDRLEQMNVFASGAIRISALELKERLYEVGEEIRARL